MTELDQYKAHVAMLTEHLTKVTAKLAWLNSDDCGHIMAITDAAEESLSRTPSESYEELKKLRDEIAKLQAERDALKADAERYRWWKMKAWFYRSDTCLQWCWPRHGEISAKGFSSKEDALDAAIDAAMQPKGE